MSDDCSHLHEEDSATTDDRNEENDLRSLSSFLTTSNTCETLNDKTTEANVSASPCSTFNEVDAGLESTVQAFTNTEDLDSDEGRQENVPERNITAVKNILMRTFLEIYVTRSK